MHAGFPCFSQDIQQVMRLGAGDRKVPELVDSIAGPVLAGGMAVLLKLGFGYVMRDCLLDKQQSEKALAFFDENFVFSDPNAVDGQRFYQGRFLLRTRRPGDNMNVWLRFCPAPDELFVDSPFGRTINSLKVVETDVVNEAEAARLARDPDKVDLVICFKDIDSIVGLIGRDDVDIVGLLLENVVQLTGNVGHLFKLGAIAKNIELELGLIKAA
ncbi:MAG TPA: hypothetical protein ENJ65_00415 [Candidatus Tenderia electrophaga]|uniref:Uncharacterized protein n=1 Tax=Candidatus Tenderia electrophaga TaxID=1748243 RepID=A0A832N4M3_9GAMM|nr:hypothetical protein [Candidatus Tenderia electrophaga]